MWFVPKKMRSKLEQRWRYGVFLGRSMSSDQNFVGLASGDVVCARAIVRLVPSVRWEMGRIAAISTSPFDFKSRHQDIIEEDPEPHNHPEPTPPKPEDINSRRLKIFDSDLQTFGYTGGCPRCEFVKKGQTLRARGARHNEECRQRLYHEMREAGVEKLKRADMEDSNRTQAQSKQSGRKAEAPIELSDTPMEPLELETEDVHISPPTADNDTLRDDFDTYNFHEEVDEVLDGDLDVDYDAEVDDNSDDHVMGPLMDVLQTLGVDAADAANFSVNLIKDVPIRATNLGDSYCPTFLEFYGQGNIVNASHGCRRDLNLNGLGAFDLRTRKPTGEPWDFCKASDRREARRFVEESKPTWVIGCPPCTFFSRWNQGLNHNKMDQQIVEERRREAVMHLTSCSWKVVDIFCMSTQRQLQVGMMQ